MALPSRASQGARPYHGHRLRHRHAAPDASRVSRRCHGSDWLLALAVAVVCILPGSAAAPEAPRQEAAPDPASAAPPAGAAGAPGSPERPADSREGVAADAPQTAPAAPAIRVGAARIEQLGPRRYLFSGDVDIRHQNMRLQADEVEYDETTHQCQARGHVVLEEGTSHLTGDQVDLNLETRLATIRNAYGEMEPDLIVEAESLEKIGEERYRISHARVTSCTQPTPYWSFRVGKGTINLGGYAHLRNVSFQIDRVPVVYIPYLMWPAKENRASGLLMPQYGYSQKRGAIVDTAWYWAPARNFDSTLYLDYLEKDGLGTGLETRWLPSENGRFRFTGYYIDERIEDPVTLEPEGVRYRFHMDGKEQLPGGWQMLADLNQVSDFDFYLDFERDLRSATHSSTASALNFTRAWSFYTLNVRGERRAQLLSRDDVLVQRRQPEIEWRGRSRQLGHSPFYFAFETSAVSLEREFSYGRFDAFPQIRAPIRPAPWIEITPSVAVRETVYTRQLDPSGLEPALDESLRRGLLQTSLDILGPRLSRVHQTPGWRYSPRVKTVLEPRVSYTYIPGARFSGAGSAASVPLFDEIDTLAAEINRAAYSLTARWFALRPTEARQDSLALPRRVPLPGLAPEPQTPAEAASTAPGAGAAPSRSAPVVAPSGADPSGAAAAPAVEGAAQTAPAKADEPPTSPVEFATLTLSQAYGFNAPQSVLRDVLGSTIDTSDYSPVNANLRINPTSHQSLNLSATYNILRRTVEQTTLSTDVRWGDQTLGLTWFLGNGVDTDQSQLRLFAGGALFRRKLTMSVETKVDLQASDIQDQRYRIGYNTQCCGFLGEYLGRDFSGSSEKEYRFVVSLKGVGKLFDLQQGVP